MELNSFIPIIREIKLCVFTEYAELHKSTKSLQYAYLPNTYKEQKITYTENTKIETV
jgi:hypothetical protein